MRSPLFHIVVSGGFWACEVLWLAQEIILIMAWKPCFKTLICPHFLFKLWVVECYMIPGTWTEFIRTGRYHCWQSVQSAVLFCVQSLRGEMSTDFSLIIIPAKPAVLVKWCLQQAQPLTAYSSYFLTLPISLIDWLSSHSLTLIGSLMTKGRVKAKGDRAFCH